MWQVTSVRLCSLKLHCHLLRSPYQKLPNIEPSSIFLKHVNIVELTKQSLDHVKCYRKYIIAPPNVMHIGLAKTKWDNSFAQTPKP